METSQTLGTVTIDNQVNNKTSGSVYYVWAIASKNDISIHSDNYVKVTTNHTHTGNKVQGTGCYTGSAYKCNGGYGMYAKLEFNYKKSVDIGNRYCTICRKYINGNHWQGAPKGNFVFYCKNCAGSVSGTSNYFTSMICLDCEDRLSNYTLADGRYITSAYNVAVDRLWNWQTSTAADYSVTAPRGLTKQCHQRIYGTQCGKIEQSASATSIDF